jgi:hypothetical protein
MQSFLARHSSKIKGTLSGFDRVRFRGTLRWLASVGGLGGYLSCASVLLKDFKEYAMGLTARIKNATEQIALEQTGAKPIYLPSSATRKENFAREIAEEKGLTQGMVCVLTCVEPCNTFEIHRNSHTKRLELRAKQGKCLHFYFYLIDSEWGWLNVRLQSWFPFTVHVVINGREWLARELLRQGIAFERRDNCFVDIADVEAAQRLMDRQLETNWAAKLNGLLRRVHPSHAELFAPRSIEHYWSANETEWATDVMFRSPEDLAELYPRLVRHALTSFGSEDVLRFLGKRPCVQTFKKAEILTHLGTRAEGARVKHALNGNSLKMYDKQESVLRVETTINDARSMTVYRASENDPDGPKSNQQLRKGVADLHRRAEISQKSNERYLEAQAAVDSEQTLAESAAAVCQRTTWKGKSARALNPLAEEDARLLEAVNRGEFKLRGFRNRDLCRLLFAGNSSLTDKQRMTKVTRLIRLLRAHGLVHKVPKTHRYTLSPKGSETITALLAARNANTRKLTELAA